MKTNIAILMLILALPFALSSQTRKAIPAGRYEALSGIKISHNGKNQDSVGLGHDSSTLSWGEVEKYFADESGEVLFANMALTEVGMRSKIFHEAKNLNQGFDLLITTSLEKDKELIKYLRGKKMIVLFDKKPFAQEVLALKNFEVINFRADKESNFYFLKTK